MQLLELHLIEAQKAAGLPISIPAAPAIPPATLGLLSVGFVESTLSDIDLAQLGDISHTDSLMHCQIKEEFDKVNHFSFFSTLIRSLFNVVVRRHFLLKLLRQHSLFRDSTFNQT